MKTRWIATVLAATFVVTAPVRAQGLGPVPGWVECNSISHVDGTVAGLDEWNGISDVAIVSSTEGSGAAVYTKLMALKPAALRIVPGIKTYGCPGCMPSKEDKKNSQAYDYANDPAGYEYADAAHWNRIALKALEIEDITGGDTVLLESETALWKFHHGAPIDLDQLAASLAVLRDTGLTFLWYFPNIRANSLKAPNLRADSMALVETIEAAVPRSIFVVSYTGYWRWTGHEVENRALMRALVGDERIIEILLCSPDGGGLKKARHTPEDVIGLLPYMARKRAIVYTGRAWFESTGKAFNDLRARRAFAELVPK